MTKTKKVQKTLFNDVVIPKWKDLDKGFRLGEFIELYENNVPLDEIAIILGCSAPKLNKTIKQFNIKKRESIVRASFRHAFGYEQIKTPKYFSELISDMLCYKLKAASCDYLIKYIDSNDCWLIEEKQTFSKYSYGIAVTQLLIGESKISANTDLNVVRKIIFCHNVQSFGAGNVTIQIIEDIETYLGIDVLIDGYNYNKPPSPNG